MTTHTNINKPFWIAHSDDFKIVHYGELQEGTEVTTAQPNLLSYDDEIKWKNKLKELGIDIEDIEL